MGDNWMAQDNINTFAEGLAKFYERVLLWNKVAGNDLLDPKMASLYTKLTIDEISELSEAYSKRDPLEYCKELADCLVTCGYLTACHHGAYVLDLGSTCPEPVSSQDYHLMLSDVIKHKDGVARSNSLLGMLEVLAISTDADMVGVLHEVMDSNFSKFVDVHDAVTGWGGDLAPVCKMIEENSKGRYKGVTSQESNGYIVFRDETGKILKAPSYLDADVRRFIPEKWLK